jgi:membrane protein required for colicin V production
LVSWSFQQRLAYGAVFFGRSLHWSHGLLPHGLLTISAFIPNEAARLASAFLLIFVAVLIAAGLLARAFQSLLSSAGLTLVDRFFGLIFGFVRGALVLVVLSTLGALTGAQQTKAWQASAIRPVLEQGAGLIRSWLPENWAKQLNAISMNDPYRSAGG